MHTTTTATKACIATAMVLLAVGLFGAPTAVAHDEIPEPGEPISGPCVDVDPWTVPPSYTIDPGCIPPFP